MSSSSSVASQPPIPYTPPVSNDRAREASEKAAAKAEEITATAVKAQAVKEAGKGAFLDIKA